MDILKGSILYETWYASTFGTATLTTAKIVGTRTAPSLAMKTGDATFSSITAMARLTHQFYGTSGRESLCKIKYKALQSRNLTNSGRMAIRRALPLRIQSKLRAYPFERPKSQHVPKARPKGYDAVTRRQIIRSKLHCDMDILDDDVEFLRTHPDDARWLRNHLEIRFWLKIEPFCDLE